MPQISLDERTLEAHKNAPRPVCTFVSVGSHQHPAFSMFHGDDLPPVYVEWLDDEAIFNIGPRSWVCGEYVAACVRVGIARREFRVLKVWGKQ